eukprot:Skav223739  [mRNA]  locus=scaffold2572:167090:171101:+ [translate_table: standard]
MEENLMVFPGKSANEADSTIMPQSKAWIRGAIEDLPGNDSFSVVLWLNCPNMGIIPSAKYEFFITKKAKTAKDEDDEKTADAMKTETKDESDEDEGSEDGSGTNGASSVGEEAEVRDVIYKLERLASQWSDLRMKDRGLSVRGVTWVFDPVKIQISHHALEGTDVSSSKEIVFIMDEPKRDDEPKKGRKKKNNGDAKPPLSIKNFGVHVQVSKLKDVSTLKLCWRCRVDSAGDGTKTIMPIRPTMCLAGAVELDDDILRLM